MRTYLQNTDLSSFAVSHAAIELIFGNIIILNSTNFHDQKVIFRSFLSSISIIDSTVSNIIVEQTVMEIVSSTMIFENMKIENIQNPAYISFILITSDSALNASAIEYLNSESTLFSIQTSQAQISNVSYTNINGGSELINIYSSNYFHLSDIRLVNTSTTSQFMIALVLSQNITIENIIVQEVSHPLFMIVKSEVTSIKYVHISNNQEAIQILDSKVHLLSNSDFSKNGQLTKASGGAISLYNSDIKIFNCSFTENTAKIGGAISFRCNFIS